MKKNLILGVIACIVISVVASVVTVNLLTSKYGGTVSAIGDMINIQDLAGTSYFRVDSSGNAIFAGASTTTGDLGTTQDEIDGESTTYSTHTFVIAFGTGSLNGVDDCDLADGDVVAYHVFGSTVRIVEATAYAATAHVDDSSTLDIQNLAGTVILNDPLTIPTSAYYSNVAVSTWTIGRHDGIKVVFTDYDVGDFWNIVLKYYKVRAVGN